MDTETVDERSYGYRRHVARLFGIRLISDLGEKLCDLGVPPPIGRKRRARVDAIRRAGVLFIHVPKNAGMSISNALYGQQIKHASIAYYHRVAPDLAALPSLAILRDPVDRFVSAYAYARTGGSRDNRISVPFRDQYRAFRSIDNALDHVEAAQDAYQVDHIFRRQTWYLTDRDGAVVVDQLLMLDDMDRLVRLAPQLGRRPLPHLNRCVSPKPALTDRQIDRIHGLYRDDLILVEMARGRRATDTPRAPAPFPPAETGARNGKIVPMRS
ncbi:hypothetical protein BH10PSE12_BH10PSE12_27550 [soil metagenome]